MTFAEFLAAAEAGAASIYHDILATGAEITSWGTNPLTAPLVSVGTAAANSLLARVGVDTTTTGVIESDVTTALKTLAAKDPTVPSIGSSITALVGLAGTVAAEVIPGAAPIVAAAEGAIGLVESLGEDVAAIVQTSTTIAVAEPIVEPTPAAL